MVLPLLSMIISFRARYLSQIRSTNLQINTMTDSGIGLYDIFSAIQNYGLFPHNIVIRYLISDKTIDDLTDNYFTHKTADIVYVFAKILVSSRNCLIKAPCIVAWHPQMVSDSVEDNGMSVVWPDFAATEPWPRRKKKNHPPVERKVSSRPHVLSPRNRRTRIPFRNKP